MNRPIRKTGIAFAVLFLALFVNLNFVQVVKGSSYRDDSRNRRVLLNEYSSPRGTIVVGGSNVVESRKTGDELKYLRVYAKGPVYAPVTGYYSVNYGTSGIEQAENNVLSGDDNRLFTSNLASLLTGRDPRGGSVQLTLSKAAQEAAYKAMGKSRGAVVALDPQTGAILALVSTPSFDPNTLASHNINETERAWAAYNASSASPLLDRALRAVYPAGSVFKVIDAAAALSQSTLPYTPASVIAAPRSYLPYAQNQFNATDRCKPGTACIENFDGEQCQNGRTARLDFALAKSCNTAFAILANKVGATAIKEQAHRFGLDEPYQGQQQPDLCNTPAFTTPLPVCQSTPGSLDDFGAPDTLGQTAIGQRDVAITPMQAALISAAVANNGVLMKPYLIAEELKSDTTVLSRTEPQQLGKAVDGNVASELVTMMEGVVDPKNPEATGHSANITDMGDAIKVGGKTGTADHCSNPNGAHCPPPHAWFTGFAFDRGVPKIAIAVIVEDGGANGENSTGGVDAAPIAKQVMEAYLRSPEAN